MAKKYFIGNIATIHLECPECGRAETMDVSKYRKLDKEIKGNVKCSCGHTYPFVLERRRFFRKETNLSGIFTHKF